MATRRHRRSIPWRYSVGAQLADTYEARPGDSEDSNKSTLVRFSHRSGATAAFSNNSLQAQLSQSA